MIRDEVTFGCGTGVLVVSTVEIRPTLPRVSPSYIILSLLPWSSKLSLLVPTVELAGQLTPVPDLTQGFPVLYFPTVSALSAQISTLSYKDNHHFCILSCDQYSKEERYEHRRME